MNHNARPGALVAVIVAVVLTVSGCGAGFGFSASPNPSVSASASVGPSTSPSATPSVQPTLSEKEKVTAEFQEWTRLMVVNFKGVTTIPKDCLNTTFAVDLTAPEFYRTRGGKETAGAFGPSMGKNPCEVSRNTAERLARDSSLLVAKANETGVENTKPADVAAKVTKLHNGPYQDRLELARKVLGWYTDPNHELTIVKKDGVYTSNTMKGDGTTATSYGNKPSTVLETRDRRNGKLVKGDRLDCGMQNFKPGVPKGYKPPKPGEEIPKLTKLSPKKASQHPANTGDAPSDGWDPAPQIDEDKEPATPPGGGTPPKTYTPPPPPPPAPAPTTPRPEPTPEPAPTSQPVPSGTPTCDPDICG